jgi:hypothetical protein
MCGHPADTTFLAHKSQLMNLLNLLLRFLSRVRHMEPFPCMCIYYTNLRRLQSKQAPNEF